MVHDARSVANELITRAHDSANAITPMQVIKLAYYCHAWMLGLYHRPLLNRPIEAWRYGPVVPDIYHSLRQYGGRPVIQTIDLELERVAVRGYHKDETNIIDQVWEKYGHLTGIQLSALTHAPGTPWHETWHKYGQNAIIPDPTIEKYYARQAERARQNEQR